MVETGPYETCPFLHFFPNSQYCWFICCKVHKDIFNAVSFDGIKAFTCTIYFMKFFIVRRIVITNSCDMAKTQHKFGLSICWLHLETEFFFIAICCSWFSWWSFGCFSWKKFSQGRSYWPWMTLCLHFILSSVQMDNSQKVFLIMSYWNFRGTRFQNITKSRHCDIFDVTRIVTLILSFLVHNICLISQWSWVYVCYK